MAIVGTAGVPAMYGGFETLADQLIMYAERLGFSSRFRVYCSGRSEQGNAFYRGAHLVHLPISANGVSSIFYDVLTSINAWWRGCSTLLVLGVSGAPVLPVLRLFTSLKIVTNVDGIEWRREKWGGLAKLYLRLAEWIAVRASHTIIADNEGIRDYLRERYGIEANVIAYGGDHALDGKPVDLLFSLPKRYALALCRIEPENNIHMILEAFSKSEEAPLVFVGNWTSSEYGRALQKQFGNEKNITLLDPIYDQDSLLTLRSNAALYIHGHSAGGTNPSLVEAMHFGTPIYSFDCIYNRYTKENCGEYFDSSHSLISLLGALKWEQRGVDTDDLSSEGRELSDIANRRYVWEIVGSSYMKLLGFKN